VMADSGTTRQWPFRQWWANVSLVVVAVLLSLYLLGIMAQLLVKTGGKGQKNVTTTEVESSIREAAVLRGADVSTVSCNESPRDEWHCEIRLADGYAASGSAVWRESGHSLGVNVELGSH
jgi:hypothetical protein